jgi:GTP-binding protein Era
VEEKSVFAALVGLPNTGKSTLLNRVVGAKLAIVSPRPQTTRGRIMGVLTSGAMQYVLLDTPGRRLPRTRLEERMAAAGRESALGADCAVFVTQPRAGLVPEEEELLGEIKRAGVPAVLALNKSDTISSRVKAARMLGEMRDGYGFEGAALTSALKGDGIGDLLAELERYASAGPHPFPEDTLTDMPEKTVVAEIIREKLLLNLRDELPHGCAVLVESFSARGGLADISAVIVCEKASHKGMIIGRGGLMLKKIGSLARADIEDFLGRRVNLGLWVKVRENWRDSESQLRGMGY